MIILTAAPFRNGAGAERRTIPMTSALPVTFASPALLIIAAVFACAAAVLVVMRRAVWPPAVLLLIGAGMFLLAVAAGQPSWDSRGRATTVVMVDVSPSTRTAAYRDAAALDARVRQLIGNRPHRTIYFAESTFDVPPAGELAARQTIFAPPPGADAIVLFSDGQFALPAIAPLAFAVIDPALDRAPDAAVKKLEIRGGTLAATVANAGPPRSLALAGQMQTIDTSTQVRTANTSPTAQPLAARFAPGDAWPENDALSIDNVPLHHSERWWVGDGAPAGWRTIAPGELPAEPTAYLAPAVIVLNNVPASSLAPPAMDRLMQYVRDLGGSLVILGGDRAFAAGGYSGTVLDNLSPLASTPPLPASHWILLVDSSGSMAAETNGRPRVSAALAAAGDVVRALPPSDLLTAGNFAKDVNWWGRRAAAGAFTGAPPVATGGPTNLDAALRAAASQADRALANEIVILTDAEAQLDAVPALAAAMKNGNARLHVLALSRGRASEALRELAGLTGGTFAEQIDSAQWRRAARELVRPVVPNQWVTTPADVRFQDVELPPRTVPAWNRTWAKPSVQQLAFASPAAGGVTMGARQRIGEGTVAAIAFPTTAQEAQAVAQLVASPPRDARFAVTWDSGPRLRVTIDARDGNTYLNGLDLTLEVGSAAGAPNVTGTTTRAASQSLAQVAPGRYELSLDASSASSIATLRHDGRVIDRVAVAGRYPPEFDGIGVDRAALAELARRTGGRVIEPGDAAPINLPGPRRGRALLPFLAGLGALLVAAGLVRWRMAH